MVKPDKRTPSAAELFDEPPKPANEWLALPAVPASMLPGANGEPYDGVPVWLTPDGEQKFVAIWRHTREFRDGRFQPTAFWAVRNAGGQRIPFEPIGWMKFEEPMYVPGETL